MSYPIKIRKASYHTISLFSQNMLKIHINKHVKGENSQKTKRGQERAITHLRRKTTPNLPTKERNTENKIKLTLPIPSKTLHETKSTNTSSTPLSNAGALAAHTLTQKQNKTKQKQKHEKQAKLQKSKSVTCLHYWEENMLSFSCSLNVLTYNLISLDKEFKKPGPS